MQVECRLLVSSRSFCFRALKDRVCFAQQLMVDPQVVAALPVKMICQMVYFCLSSPEELLRVLGHRRELLVMVCLVQVFHGWWLAQ